LANSGSNVPGAHADGVTDALTTSDGIRKFFVANAWDLIVRSAYVFAAVQYACLALFVDTLT
jgi:hypothetical protein